jgi:hypothetical protein
MYRITNYYWLKSYPKAKRRIILKWIFDNWNGERHGLDRSASRQGQVAGSRECGFHKTREIS